MRIRFGILSFAFLFLLDSAIWAERPPEPRNKADLVIIGKVTKFMAKKSKLGKDGERTEYTAKVEISKVESGKDAKVGDTVTVTWFRITKAPGGGFVGAFGQDHKLAEKDEARFWLMKGKDNWSIIYNRDGVEKLKK